MLFNYVIRFIFMQIKAKHDIFRPVSHSYT